MYLLRDSSILKVRVYYTLAKDDLTTLDEQTVWFWSACGGVCCFAACSHCVLTAKDMEVALITSHVFEPHWTIDVPVVV